ncbi:MAG: diguanylate cyclase [Deltaproteobacteria bacterium]|nr:diguanylate cyclase [Deltaproteobacteria bacterium]MBW2136105.1 diguanylate cyclase [Deltaproteobacteria bacterium]
MEHEIIDYRRESILVVEDDQGLRKIFEDLLSFLGFSVRSTSTAEDALNILNSNTYTFLLTDMRLPEMDGLEFIEKVSQDFPDVSIIAMTGFTEGYKYVDVINAGAQDFIKKPFDIGELEAKVRRIIHERNLRKELNRLSITDALTGLYNQGYFHRRLKEEVLRAKRQKHPLALILLDLDNFKYYNDKHGHLAGDEILRKVGILINNCIREGVDSGFRYGGDEFAVILIDADLSIAREIGKRIQESFNNNLAISASLGYTIFSEGMSDKEFIAKADEDLYETKMRKQRAMH